MDDITTIIFLICGGFISGFVDSIAGGGGIISLPVILLTGMNPVAALATNKMAAVMGSFTSAVTFIRNGKVDISLIKYLFPLSLAGSLAGVLVVRLIPADFLRPLVVILLVLITIYTLCRKNWGQSATYHGTTKKILISSIFVALIIGFYDGFFGPGTGSFLMFAFLCMGLDFVGAAANARVLNFASNFSAVVAFAYLGQIYFHYAIPMGLAMVIGAYCGTKAALSHGAAYVKPLFVLMTVLLIGKQVWDLFK
ncbi:TSUP family transporter [Pectinatus haikarae]|uniref:Probable membrane transporter protein n=1 Tax=Pectinatus haikarae TaxID=349096 RepID=A0ABT9YBE6_9FIRM|nr:TSUP family transporter [Pectinatus haikarae]MDQ0205162.1 putative membrane protein YfcA [Pectinatus haikarae]